jgi:hypothetical protein
MKNNIIAFTGFSVLVILGLVAGFLVVRPVLAQVDATSSPPAPDISADLFGMSSTSTIDTIDATAPTTTAGTTTEAVSHPPESVTESTTTTDTALNSVHPIEPPPVGLARVHIIGTKYIDYFTDGSTTVVMPGDPQIDANLDKPDDPHMTA